MPYKYGKSLSRKGPRMPKKRMASTAWYNKKYSTYDLAKSAWSTAKYLKGLINVEHQKLDFSFGGTVSTTPASTNVSNLTTGDVEGTRTGNSILCKYLYMKATAQLNSAANFSRLRLVVVRDKQQIGDTVPSYTDVYESSSTIALLNKNTAGRFDILYDRNFDLDANNPQILVDQYIKLNSHMRYNGNSGSDIQKGGIYILYVSDQATNVPTLGFNARLTYIDN